MYAIALHGGAGRVDPQKFTAADKAKYIEVMEAILDGGSTSLKRGKSALETVVQTVKALEDEPLFNSGRGSVLDRRGKVSMDASVMCGGTLSVGGVTDCRKLKNPILAARWVLENSEHSLITGRELEDHLRKQGYAFESMDYFVTEKRNNQFLKAQKESKVSLDHDISDSNTVGAVALDKSGHVAAATSTGGVTYKFPGRVSDSSIGGLGNYANNNSCALSATGTGDVFFRMGFCYDIHAQMIYGGRSLAEACEQSLHQLKDLGGIGGIIGLTAQGEILLKNNSGAMFCAAQKNDDPPFASIFNDHLSF